MADRDWQIFGPALVKVKCGQHLSGTPVANHPGELGLTADAIRITLTAHHEEVIPDEFGKAPAELSWQMAVADVYMTLVHFDPVILRFCLSESAGGGGLYLTPPPFRDIEDVVPYAMMKPAGSLMGNGLPRMASGNHFIGLNVVSASGEPWRFLCSYLAEQPVVYPLGTEHSAVQLHWRAVPYQSIYQALDANPNLPISEFFDSVNLTYQGVNAPTNNGPVWTRKMLTLPVASFQLYDPTANDFEGETTTVVASQNYEVVREILASGVALYDNIPDE